MGKEDMKGLYLFISDIRAAKSTEAEAKRINKELANIRSKFADKKQLDGYQRKKYISKLVFIFLLGHDIEFGQAEAVALMSAAAYSEKQTGYLFTTVLLNESNDLWKLVIQAIKTDLASRQELNVCIALNCVANLGGKDTAVAVFPEVMRLLVADESPNFVRKKAALAALQLFRRAPEDFPAGEHTARLVQILSSPDLGVVTAVASLLTSLSASNPDEYKGVVHVAATRLHRLVLTPSDANDDYVYYSVTAPWLTVKLLRLLQLFPMPSDKSVAQRISESLSRILSKGQEMPPGKPKVQYFNAMNACLFEAINLIAHYDTDPDMEVTATTVLGNFLVHREVNMRFLALEGLAVMAQTEFSRDAVKKHQSTVLKALQREADSTVQRRAVDVLYALCDQSSVKEIVEQLLAFLARAEYAIREELVIKIAILSEKFVTDYAWYVDSMLRLIRVGGDHITEAVWHRVIQVIINRPDVQDYAAKTCYEALLDPSAHEAMVNVGGYILGEFGHLIANDIYSLPAKQLDVLQNHYPMVSAETRALLLSTYVKLTNLFPEIKGKVQTIMSADNFVRNSNTELQQRANEYIALTKISDVSVLQTVLDEMPPFNEQQVSILQRLVDKSTSVVADKTGALAAIKRAKPDKKLDLTAVGGAGAPGGAAMPAAISNEAFVDKFILQDKGVLYENPALQIGVKMEFHANLGRITLYYGNRGDAPMTNVTTRAYMPTTPDAMSLEVNPIDRVIAPGAQLQQLISVECKSVFATCPILELGLSYQGRAVSLSLKLPVFVNKFLEPLGAQLNSDSFFEKWNALGGPPREVKEIIQAKIHLDDSTVSQTLVSYGLSLIPNVDPKPHNKVCAAILHTTNGQIGVLARIEPNADAKAIRNTIRSSNEHATAALSKLLATQF